MLYRNPKKYIKIIIKISYIFVRIKCLANSKRRTKKKILSLNFLSSHSFLADSGGSYLVKRRSRLTPKS